MRAVYLTGKGKLEEKNIQKPVPQKNQVLIKVKSVGVCGSDIHYWEHGQIGKFVVKDPLILGHEVSGEIAEIGEGVSGFSLGDKVVIEPGTPCGRCEFCKTGRYNLCPEILFFATPPVDGALCEYVAHNSELVFKIPDGIDMDVATLVEPLSVGTFATQKVDINLRDKVIIYGSGVIGICCLIMAKEAGAGEVTLVDVRDDRLELAREMGADSTVNILKNETLQGYYDVAYECSGVQSSLVDASKSVKPGGRISMIGLGAKSMQEAPIVDFVVNEQNLITSFRYAHAFPATLEVIQKHKDILSKLITHRYSLDEVKKAFETARHEPSAVKVVVNI